MKNKEEDNSDISIPSYILDSFETAAGPVPSISRERTAADKLGEFKVRTGRMRMNYRVDPGLYALGQPNRQSPVLVSANYKLTFDHLRSSLPGLSVWILILDTGGINVWCAAGKGTFGTEELVDSVALSHLSEVVDHRTLIVPQLGAPGVSGYKVKEESGFRVIFGPVDLADLPAFLKSGNRSTAAMRKKEFPIAERVALTGIELNPVFKYFLPAALLLFLVSGLGWPGNWWVNSLLHGMLGLTALISAIIAGAVITPILLPWLPGRAFSWKGLSAGMLFASIHAAIWLPQVDTIAGKFEIGGWFLTGIVFAAFLAMNFTGATTFTSISGVQKEMKIALPLQVAGAVIGLILIVISRFIT